jgi:hypothetical protein
LVVLAIVFLGQQRWLLAAVTVLAWAACEVIGRRLERRRR